MRRPLLRTGPVDRSTEGTVGLPFPEGARELLTAEYGCGVACNYCSGPGLTDSANSGGCVVTAGAAAFLFSSQSCEGRSEREFQWLPPCFGLLGLSAGAARRRPDVGAALCSAAPSSRRACPGGTDLAPQPLISFSRPLGPRRGFRPFSALPRWAEGGDRLRLGAAARPDLSQSSSATSSLAPSGGATRNPDAAACLPSASAVAEGQSPKNSSSLRSAWGQPVPRRPYRQGHREHGRAAAYAAADLRWLVKSGPYLRDEGDSDSSAGRKVVMIEETDMNDVQAIGWIGEQLNRRDMKK
nr:forkhead box protein O1-like [Manis javanica]